MMADVSIITAATRPSGLSELYTSLTAQSIDWEWVIQLDGPALGWDAPADTPWLADSRVTLDRNAKPLGSGTTRNQALMRSGAPRVLCVDDDDQIAPGALGALVPALDANADCFGAWGATRSFTESTLDTRPFKSWHAPETIGPGTILRQFEESGHFPVHVGAVLWRRSHLIAAGGYAALPRSVDTNPFMACEALFPHRYVDEDVYLYRLHGDQMTREPAYIASEQRVHAFNFARAHALQDLLATDH